MTDAGRQPPARSVAWLQNLSRKVGIMTAGTMASIALAFALSVMVARLLGPERLASYATVTAAALVLAQFSDLGLANAFGYFARHRPGSVHALLNILIRHLLFSAAGASAVVAVATAVGGVAIAEALAPLWFRAVLVVFVTAAAAGTVLPVLVLARGHYGPYVLFTTMNAALHLAAVLLTAALVGTSWRAFITAIACANAAIALAEFGYLRRLGSRTATEMVTSRESYGYGLRIKWGELMKLLSGRMDLFVVAAVLPAPQVGAFSVLISFRELGMTPLRTYTGILQNLIVDRSRARVDDRDLVLGTLLVQASISIALSAVAAVLLPILLPIVYGPAFDVGGPAAVLFSSTIFLSVAGLCWVIFNMSGRPQLTSQIVTVSGVTAPFVVWALARQSGLYGAAFAAVANGVIVCLLSVIALARMRRYTRKDLLAVLRRVPSLVGDVRAAAFSSGPDIVPGSQTGRP
jgi:O-antigen/teichoic acid export membrane protein